jgi:hypothetical protein
MYDASQPLTKHPAADITAFYIGGDTPHVWRMTEIDRSHTRYRLPIWVRSDPQAVNAVIDARDAIDACDGVGLPNGCFVALDLETAYDPGYVIEFEREVNAHGYQTLLYGSRSSLFDNPGTFYWVAAPGRPALYSEPGRTVVATQYDLQADYDLSVVDPNYVMYFWDTGGEMFFWQRELGAGVQQATWTIPEGASSAIGFGCDNGVLGVTEPVTLRVSCHVPGAGWGDVHELALNSTLGKSTLPLPARCDMISVIRTGDQGSWKVPVGADAH